MRTQIGLQNKGNVLIGLVLIILLFSSLAVLFINRVSSREFLLPNNTRATQVNSYARSGIEYAIQYAYNNSSFIQANYSRQISLSDATLTMSYVKNTDTLTSLAVMSGDTGEQSAVRLTNFSKYIPPRNTTVYATVIGSSGSIWTNAGNACDSASGPNTTYATITSSHNNKIQTFAGFNTQSRSSSITKVEAVIHYYLPTALTKGYLYVRWGRQSDSKKGSYASVNYRVLNSSVNSSRIGTLVLDMGTATNIGGWSWSYFAPPTDFQIEIRTTNLTSTGRIYIDAAGYKISW